jgi:hypothetical protein
MNRRNLAIALASALLAAGCGEGVGSEEDAERAYQGLDTSIDKAIDLGFDGYNAASSANIPPQSTRGDEGGTMTVAGKVDQGSSDNKTMSLTIELVDYTDDALLLYSTEIPLPVIDMKLAKIPDGTVDGTLAGTFFMTGDLEGPVKLNLTFSGDLQAGAGGALVERKPGTTRITGTAESDFGVYDVDVTR